MFGNTATVAEAVAASLTAEGMSVTCVDVADAPPLESVEADLLVVGAPTHAFSLSRPGTREEAVRQGAPAGARPYRDPQMAPLLPPSLLPAADRR